MSSFSSYSEAERQVAEWSRQYPSAQFAIRQESHGNKVMWSIVQTNRFSAE